MASTEDKAYEIMRELDVNYVLVIFGGLTGYSSDGNWNSVSLVFDFVVSCLLGTPVIRLYCCFVVFFVGVLLLGRLVAVINQSTQCDFFHFVVSCLGGLP